MIENAHVETALLADGISTVDSGLSGCCKIEMCRIQKSVKAARSYAQNPSVHLPRGTEF